MDTSNTVPYVPDQLGEPIPTNNVTVEVDGNRRIVVGSQPTHPLGPGYLHHIYNTQPDGVVTELRFFLTREAVEALILCYKTHGLISCSQPELDELDK